MKSLKLAKKTALVMLGLIGLGTVLTSCHKERDCKCTSVSTYTYDGQTQTETNTESVTTKEKCWELDRSYKGDNYSTVMTCE